MQKNSTAFSSRIRWRRRYARMLARAAFIALVLSLILYACGGVPPSPTDPAGSPASPGQPQTADGAAPPCLDSNGTYTEAPLGARKQPGDHNATAREILLPGLPYGDPEAEAQDLEATACIKVSDHMGKSMQQLQDVLHAIIQKKLVAAALNGGTDSGVGDKNARPVDNSLLSGLIIDKEGYYNGEGFGELCVEAKGKLSQTLMARYQKKRMQLAGFCYSNAKLADNLLQPYAMTAALKQLISHQDARLGDLSVAEIREVLSRVVVNNSRLDAARHTFCLDIAADYDPMRARRVLQAHVLTATKQEEAQKHPADQLAHYSLYLDITPYPVGRPASEYGEAVSVVEGPEGKALGLTGTASGWATFTNLNQAGKPVPSVLENNGRLPGPEDRFGFAKHPIGDFNATIKIAYTLHMRPEDTPLELQLLELAYGDHLNQEVSINLSMNKAKRKYISFGLGKAHTNILPFDWGQKPVNLTVRRQKNILKLFANQQFLLSALATTNPLESIAVNLLNGSMLYALRMEAEQARPKPKQPTGPAGMIPFAPKQPRPKDESAARRRRIRPAAPRHGHAPHGRSLGREILEIPSSPPKRLLDPESAPARKDQSPVEKLLDEVL